MVVPATTLDIDKLERAVNDGLQDGGLIKNDSRVVQSISEKHYAEERTGCQVTVVKHGATAVHIDFKELE